MFFWNKRKFRVLIEGGNLLLEMPNREKFGFYTTRYVKATGSEEAGQWACKLVLSDIASLGVLNSADDPPSVEVSRITELWTFLGLKVPGKGFTFFPMVEPVKDSSLGKSCRASALLRARAIAESASVPTIPEPGTAAEPAASPGQCRLQGLPNFSSLMFSVTCLVLRWSVRAMKGGLPDYKRSC